MFKSDKKEVFSFRKYKGYGLASAVIAAFFFASSVSADVVNNGDGTTTLSNDKASIVVDTSKFKEDNEKTATELFNEGSYEAETVTTGKESVAVESKTTVKYQTEDGEQIDEDVVKTTSETKELDYKVTGKSGKEYTGDNSATSTVNADLEKKALIEKDGERYKYVRTETTQGEESVLTNMTFNDVETKSSVEGMYNADGSIKYDKIENGTRVWVLEELEDGSYGKYALIENAQNLNDDQIREAAKTATSKFSKAEVEAKGGFQATDSVVVYETNTYAARKQETNHFGKDFYYNNTANESLFRKNTIDKIFEAGLEGLEKRDNSYFYKGVEVPTIENFKTNPVFGDDNKLSGYDTDTDNNYYTNEPAGYTVRTIYYNVINDFFIKNPESEIFKNKAGDVFWGADSGDVIENTEEVYSRLAFVTDILNKSLKDRYNIDEDTQDFKNKTLESKSNNNRPVFEKKYSFKKTDLHDHVKSWQETHDTLLDKELWVREFSNSYSIENVRKVRNLIKAYQNLYGAPTSDVFNNKNDSDVSVNEYAEAIYNNIANTFIETYKDQFTEEGAKAIKNKFGNSPILRIGERVGYTLSLDSDTNSSSEKDMTIQEGEEFYRNSPGIITENTEIFTYHDVITPLRAYRLNADENIVRHIYAEVKKGSVVATYSDEEGNKLADDVNVKTDEYAGEDYRTEAKTIRPIYEVETVNGLTKTTIIRYELISTPANANGQVVAETTIVVPYVYRKVVTVDIKGSVIATYKDEEGNILASEEKVITNQNAGTYYAAASKLIQASASSKVTENGREVTLITYELIKTPDNETGEVVGGETLVVPYVYRKVVTNKLVPNNPPVVEEETLKVTRFHTDQGEELQSDVAGFEDAPNIIGDYQFTGTTELNESNDVQTHIYTKIVTEIPNEAPILEVPELKATRYQTEDGTEIKDTEEGFVDAPKIIGDYQYTGTTETNESGDVQTHIYTKIVTEIPNEAPKVELIDAEVTRYMLEDRETEIADWKPGLHEHEDIIGQYQYTGVTDTDDDGFVRTHIYKLIETDIPGDAPVVEIPSAKVTRFHSDTGEELQSDVEGFEDAPKMISDYQFTGTTETNEAGDVQTHIYTKIVSEIPNDAPKHELPEMKATRFVDGDGNELKSFENGLQEPVKSIGDYQYTGTSYYNDGKDVLTHVYSKVVTEIPRESLVLDKIEYKMTRYVDEQGQELTLFDFGLRGPKAIEDYVFTGRTDSNEAGDVLTHVYRKVVVETKIPGDAPIVDVPELKVTRYVNEKGEEIKDSETGLIDAPKIIGEYEFTGKTEFNDGKDVQTHIYKLVEKPVTPEPKKPEIPRTPEPKKPEIPRTPEPKKPEVPRTLEPKKPETPKPVETPKSNDSKPVVVESSEQSQFVKNELPKTGEANSNLALVGVSLLTSLGLIGFINRKREN